MIKKLIDDDYMNEEYDIFDDDFEYENEAYDEETAVAFEKDMREFLNYIISLDDILTEEFTSPRNMRDHFHKHCLGHDRDKRSTRRNIYYDFNDNSKYVEYERKISTEIRETKYAIDSLYDYDMILRYMRKLFEGNVTIMFACGCRLNNNGQISLSFHTYASDVTKNYQGGNTVDVCIKNRSRRTITLFAVDAHDVERRLNNILANYSDYEGRFGINAD